MDESQDRPSSLKLDKYFITSPSETSRPTANITEVSHIAFLANLDTTIERAFQKADGSRKSVKELDANWLCFYTMIP